MDAVYISALLRNGFGFEDSIQLTVSVSFKPVERFSGLVIAVKLFAFLFPSSPSESVRPNNVSTKEPF